MVRINVKNVSEYEVELIWHDYFGNEVDAGVTFAPGQTLSGRVFVTHPFSAVVANDPDIKLLFDDREVFVTESTDNDRVIEISQKEEPVDPATVPTVTGSTGTIFLNGQWIPDDGPTTYISLESQGSCVRTNYDRRDNQFI